MTKMISPGVKALIAQVVVACGEAHKDWADIFTATYTDTLTNALQPDQGTVFVLTGDIPAMWQRDSSAQMRPYLIPAQHDAEIADVIQGVIARQMQNTLVDPYANAFNRSANGAGFQDDDTVMGKAVWERKYELDSLCYPAQLAYLFWRNTGRTAHFDEVFEAAVSRIVEVIKQEQHHQSSPYTFQRHNGVASDTLVNGVGTPVAETGMSWCGFRPSDDACQYGYLVPASLFAAATLRHLATIYQTVLNKPEQAQELIELSDALRKGVNQYGLTTNAAGETIYAYEVDGLGHVLLMDDANVPSLLSLPYLGAIDSQDPVYQATRRTILSPENPYYFSGRFGAGIGSPHTPNGYFWPIAVAMQGLTDTDRKQKVKCLTMLAETTGGTMRMHEGIDVNDSTQYTRPWFSWANMMFCELLLDYLGYRIKQ